MRREGGIGSSEDDRNRASGVILNRGFTTGFVSHPMTELWKIL